MLSKRLKAIANLITPGNWLVDVGTDHAYLPIYAVQSGICPGALATDVKEGPLEAARAHIAEYGVYVNTRLSDGLHQVEPEEGDTLAIAGMGGMLTIRILSECPEVTRSFREIILAPQSDVRAVRAFMADTHTIEKDVMVEEDGKFYPVMRYISGGESLTETQLRYGKCRNDVVKAYLQKELGTKDRILSELTTQEERIKAVRKDRAFIVAALEELDANPDEEISMHATDGGKS